MPTPEEIVFALCHEVANLMAGLRLEAEALGGPRGTALTGHASRAGSLIALVRPLLAPRRGETRSTPARLLLEGLRRDLDGDPRVRVEAPAADELPEVRADADTLHYLVVAELMAALDELPPGETASLALEPAAGGVALVLESRGRAGTAQTASDTLAGRSLTRALSEALLARWGGRLDVKQAGGRARVAFVLSA